MSRAPGSFRDVAGYVYIDEDAVYRTINPCFREEWEQGVNSGFLSRNVSNGSLIAFEDAESDLGGWKTLRVERIPFISFPYEWSFHQLRDAALLTLSLQANALKSGMTLKDATAFNIQFRGVKPVFIDLLSFELRTKNEPWSAYGQFCRHFLAPLALDCRTDLRCGALSKLWIDGIPLDLAVKFMPLRSRLHIGLFLHLFLHARMEARHGDNKRSANKAKNIRVSDVSQENLIKHLSSVIHGLKLPRSRTEWGDYYSDTNYTSEAEKFKLEFVAKVAEACGVRSMAVDLGANTGRYSREIAKYFDYVLGVDIDPLAVDKHYLYLRENGPSNVLPLVLDLSNPSPSMGWMCRERASFGERCRADMVSALALIHHLTITNGIPLSLAASQFAEYLKPDGTLLLEFVPKEDSQIKRLLAVRKDVFPDYTLDGMRRAFSGHFEEERTIAIPETVRTLHVFRKKR